MPDIAMCQNPDCFMSQKCYRHADSGTKPNTPYQGYMSFEPRQETGKDFVCDGLWLRAQAGKPPVESEDEIAKLESRIKVMEEAFRPLLDVAEGLSYGTDWNSGTQAKAHGYRQKLLDALPHARAALEGK